MSKLALTVCIAIIAIELVMGVISVSGRYTAELKSLQSKITTALSDYSLFIAEYGIPNKLFFQQLTKGNNLINEIHIIDIDNLKEISGSGSLTYQLDYRQIQSENKRFITVTTAGTDGVLISIQPFKYLGVSMMIVTVSDLAEIQASSTAFAWRIVGITLLIIILVVASVLISARIIIVRPVHQLIDMVKNIAEGERDLTIRLNVKSRDEFSDLAGWFNLFIEKLQDIIKTITLNITTLSTSLKSLDSVSSQILISANEVAEESQQADVSTQESNASIILAAEFSGKTAQNMDEIVSNINNISSMAETISEKSNNAAETTKNAVLLTEEAIEQVEKLGKSAVSVHDIINTISGISKKIDLLALNATIEAARAGESGKGFSVVANEVKELAKKTFAATAEITPLLDNIEKDIKNSVNSIFKVSKVIHTLDEFILTVVSAVNDQTAFTREISEKTDYIYGEIQEVNQNVAHSAEATGDIVEKVRKISQKNGEISQHSTDLSQNADELLKIAENIRQSIAAFKL